MDINKHLKNISKFPESPGVYIMKDIIGKCLYIGKAINLKSRVRSYFSDGGDGRIQVPYLVSKVENIEWIATNNEIEALILEANLIRSYNPPYNIDLKDDKRYPYLKLTTQETFPRLLVVRKAIKDGSSYFGPYTDASNMRRILDFAKKIFKIRDCSLKLPLSRKVRPCINHSIGICDAPCADLISIEEYRKNVEMLIKFLKGQRSDITNILKEKMEQAAQNLQFEKAASFRDQINLLQRSNKMQKVDLKTEKGSIDVFGIFEIERRTCLCVLSFIDGLLLYKQHFTFKRTSWESAAEDRDPMVIQFYNKSVNELPSHIYLPSESGFSADLLENWFRDEKNHKIKITIPQKGLKNDLIQMAVNNARLYLAQKSSDDPDKNITDLATLMELPRIPRTIEAFDISNMGEKFTVAAMVAFKHGLPDKKNYRNFKIKTVEGQDDFAMMMEAVTRRLDRLSREERPFPDLLLIDGGKGQLSAASQPLEKYSNPPMIISLAKKEELLFSPFMDEPLRLPEAHPVRRLVQRIRDEVHRRAITYHRKIRGKQFGRSSLEDIDGVGPKSAKELLKVFGSIKRLKEASVEDISQVKGFSLASAEKLKMSLKN